MSHSADADDSASSDGAASKQVTGSAEQHDSDGATAGEDDAGRGRWSENEDKLVRSLVAQHGASSWSTIAQSVTGRSGKQCRER
jgi:hypothetical protein